MFSRIGAVKEPEFDRSNLLYSMPRDQDFVTYIQNQIIYIYLNFPSNVRSEGIRRVEKVESLDLGETCRVLDCTECRSSHSVRLFDCILQHTLTSTLEGPCYASCTANI